MTKVVTFPQDAILYPEVSVKALSQAVKNIWYLVQQQKLDIEVIREKNQRIGVCSRELDDTVRDSIPQLQAVLKQLSPQDYFKSILEIDEALENPDLDDDSRNELLKARAEQLRSLNRDIKNIILILHKESNQLSSQLANLLSILVSEHLDGLLEKEQARQAELQTDIAQKEQKKTQLVGNRDKIIESQDVIRQYNLADIFKDYIPSASDVDKLDLSNPKKEAIKQAIKQGIEIANKILGNISKGLKYAELADTRVKLDKQIEQLNQESDNLKTQLQKVEQRISGITDVQQIETERSTLLLQATKLEKVWGIFSNQLQETIDHKIDQQALTKLIHSQLEYLDNLESQYNTLVLS
ncbi:alpha-xenorhabdolysin family binary toxin subunit B [Xenorhabdus sp. Flor]|uniref:alpha-xenorhabdolysin family binary toxin subunit B n=1 Tax=Xenorhabdus cabanillasii TaxID=351673 RepID=UPI0019C5DAF7|nr:alpha-xenorhabdolysin family binary toxin subunit B [Xenorhabdus sp. Flor]MBD2814781.1 alpha-xenorhabdolysin family binary toxin subunit B [Xenorhabdus sp. Flor]